ncbi:hypothetical protein L211DRAFT_806768 [Terfezia boudieri ATCC MYA-4762]|uniref:Mitochondrial import inner membrane translocase subunit n=1 Tax=Terfezia boudieri ATCC MYA-4762 TaxID=1051890 RepID=A0A3N4LW26_9PEZI|nr:hypothetical protein L211DRAFT_806768 [Terfezia boudieri ATCC MYA-4762]
MDLPADFTLTDLDSRSKAELQQFLQQEEDKAKLRTVVHVLTERCFKKCITSKINSSVLDKSEETCLQSCVERFIDTQHVILGHLGKGGR